MRHHQLTHDNGNAGVRIIETLEPSGEQNNAADKSRENDIENEKQQPPPHTHTHNTTMASIWRRQTGKKAENICRTELCLSAWKYVICRAMARIARRISVWHFHCARALVLAVLLVLHMPYITFPHTHSRTTQENTFVSNDFRMLRIMFAALRILQFFFLAQHHIVSVHRSTLGLPIPAHSLSATTTFSHYSGEL